MASLSQGSCIISMMYSTQYHPPRKRRWPYLVLILLVVVVYCVWAIVRPLKPITPSLVTDQFTSPVPAAPLAWPASSQAAVTIVGSSIMETRGTQTPTPMASTAKLITCLVVLEAKPLKPRQTGPVIPITDKDVAMHQATLAADGSNIPVKAGVGLTQYQMIQAIMLPSANNIADALAIWAFGSLDAYSKAANDYTNRHGLTSTTIGSDASGLAPTSVSTARDLARIGELSMQQPVLAEIVGQTQANNIPVAGTIRNVNILLGNSNIVGVKTGNTDQAGGVFVGASRTTVNGQPVTIITAVAKAPDLFAALRQSLNLIRTAQTNFQQTTPVTAGTTVANYILPWGGAVSAITTSDLSTKAWGGSTSRADPRPDPLPTDAKDGQKVGRIFIPKSAVNPEVSTSLKLKGTPTEPSIGWRLTHPFN